MPRWKIKDTGKAIEWIVTPGASHTDDIEMAGFYAANIVTYGTDGNELKITHHPVFPTLRLRPNNTHASYQLTIGEEHTPRVSIGGEKVSEKLVRAEINGTLLLESVSADEGLAFSHRFYPSTDYLACYEAVTVKNVSPAAVEIAPTIGSHEIDQTLGPMGINILEVTTDFEKTSIPAGGEYTYYIIFTGRLANEQEEYGDPEDEYRRRLDNIERLTAPLKLDTGNPVLDTMFRFAKLRAGESVFDTMYGLLHSPGGMSYYAATWCNDQVEYAGPYFAYTGDPDLLDASMNAYLMYTPFMSNRFNPIPSSVIAEGIDFWNGAGDRGDAAMYLYGASRFVLTSGDRDMAEELLPGIEWCAEYCRRKINDEGVVASDSDELENRFPSGNANLCTSTLAYAGYLSASALERSFGNDELADKYAELAKNLRTAIESYFGANIHGFDTYKYYKECEVLRSWICMPLCVGIFDRAKATSDALSSDYLMKSEGLLTTEENSTIWDRSTLYGLRGILASGFTEKGAELLLHYSENRLLGERVPYAVEAYPEGGKRHLSGESSLFCKIITEGMLDITPTGLNSFTVKPTLPDALDHIYLREIHAHGATFDILVERGGYKVIRSDGKLLAEGKNGEISSVEV